MLIHNVSAFCACVLWEMDRGMSGLNKMGDTI